MKYRIVEFPNRSSDRYCVENDMNTFGLFWTEDDWRYRFSAFSNAEEYITLLKNRIKENKEYHKRKVLKTY